MNKLLEVKICLIGDDDKGKTSLAIRYCHGKLDTNDSTPTIGASFLQRRLWIDNTEVVYKFGIPQVNIDFEQWLLCTIEMLRQQFSYLVLQVKNHLIE